MGRYTGLSTQRGRIRLGIGLKLATLLLVTLLVTLTLPTLLGFHDHEQDLLAEHDRHGREIARLTAGLLSERMAGSDTQDLATLLHELTRKSDVVYARVENGAGDTLAAAGPPAGSPGDPPGTADFREDIRANGSLLGRVVLGLSTERLAQARARHERQALWAQGIAIFSVLTVTLMSISTLVARPLAVIHGVLRAGNHSDRARIDQIPLYGNHEFGDLARELNVLGRRLEEDRQALAAQAAANDQALRDAHRRLEVQGEELRELNRELEQRSMTDPLTGLYNHRYFETLMDTEVERCVRNDETTSILLIEINDLPARIGQAGHHDGDELIRGIAGIVAEHTRPSDVACRYGDCGFFMLCRRATIANAVAIADDLQRDLADRSFLLHGRPQHVTASIGVATIPGVHRVASAANLLDCADRALRHSRETGHAVVHYSMLDHPIRPAAL